MIHPLTGVLVVAAWIGALVFVARYLFTEWFKSTMGRHAMVFMLVALALLSLACARELFGASWPGRAWVRLAAYALAAAVIWWRDLILFTVQGRVRRRARTGRAGAMMTATETEDEER